MIKRTLFWTPQKKTYFWLKDLCVYTIDYAGAAYGLSN